MRHLVTAAGTFLLGTTAASAGGIDRMTFGSNVLFEPGNYAEVSVSRVRPDVSGAYPVALGGGSTGDMAQDYTSLGFAYKNDLSDRLALGFFLNKPYGADANYPGGFYTGLSAEWESRQVALVLKYDVTPNISVYGGGKYVESAPEILIPPLLTSGGTTTNPLATYQASGETDGAGAVIIGAAYQRPEIALRVALTYEGGYTHAFDTVETLPAALLDLASTTEVEMPQSLTLDFQSGIAAGTLVFGSLRWSEWSVWEVRPAGYEGLTGDRVTGFDNDVVTYRLGIGNQLTEDLSVFTRVTYERETGDVASRLSPTDGQLSVGLGATYNFDNIRVTGGVEYARLGDASDASGVRFSGNEAVGLALSVGYRF